MLNPTEKQGSSFPGTDYGDHRVLLGQGVTKPSASGCPHPPLHPTPYSWMEAGTWEKQENPCARGGLAANWSRSPALPRCGPSRCHPAWSGHRGAWAEASTILLTQAESEPCPILLPRWRMSLPNESLSLRWENTEACPCLLICSSVGLQVRKTRLPQARNGTEPLLGSALSARQRGGGCERRKPSRARLNIRSDRQIQSAHVVIIRYTGLPVN